MPNDYPLPDGRTLVLPDNLSVGDRAFLRQTLGPEGYAAMQAHLASRQPLEQAATEQTERQVRLGKAMNRAQRSPTPFTNAAALYAPISAAKSLIGAEVGGRAGGYVGKQISPESGEDYGKLIGGGIGAIAGSMAPGDLRSRIGAGIRTPSGRVQSPSEIALGKAFPDPYAPKATPAQPIPPGTNYGQYLENQRGVGVPGSAAQEAGYQPPVTKAPFPREGGAPVTVEQVPGPDTAGKGNLLTPAARRGVPGAGEELVRRGRPTLFVPREEYPGTRLQGTLSERISGGGSGENVFGDKPPETEDFMERMRRRAPGENPAIKSIRRKMGGDTSKKFDFTERLRKRAEEEQ